MRAISLGVLHGCSPKAPEIGSSSANSSPPISSGVDFGGVKYSRFLLGVFFPLGVTAKETRFFFGAPGPLGVEDLDKLDVRFVGPLGPPLSFSRLLL